VWAAILAALQAIPKLIDLGTSLVAAYQAHVKLLWSQSLQSGLQPLEQGQPTSDQQKADAAKAVADAIKNMH